MKVRSRDVENNSVLLQGGIIIIILPCNNTLLFSSSRELIIEPSAQLPDYRHGTHTVTRPLLSRVKQAARPERQ